VLQEMNNAGFVKHMSRQVLRGKDTF